MTQFGSIRHFNTGAPYTAQGQPISWAVFNTPEGVEGIIYQDHARMITKCIPLPGVAGHTCHYGEVKPCTIQGRVDDNYVKACEREGLNHDIRNLYSLEWPFQKLVAEDRKAAGL